VKNIIRLTESDLARIVRRVINEANLPNPWTDTTTALQGIATYYNTELNKFYQAHPDKPKNYFSVNRTHNTDAVGNEIDIAWQSFFGSKPLSGTDKMPSSYIIDQRNLVARPEITQRVNGFIATPISVKFRSITNGAPTTGVVAQVNTAVVAINAALKKAKYSTKP